MNRRVLTLLVAGLAIAGCSHGRSSIRDINRGAELPPAGASELPPIETSAEAGTTPADVGRPAVNTWSRGVGNTTRGQSPDQPEDDQADRPATPGPAVAPATRPAASGSSTLEAAPPAEAPIQANPSRPGEMRVSELKSQISPGQLLGITMATVGGEAITSSELQFQFNEFLRERGLNKAEIPPDQGNMLVHHVLEEMVDRAIIIQEAKRTFLKSAAQKKMFDEYSEKQWLEHELPPMIRKNKVANAFELRRKLQERGESLDDYKRRFERKFLASEFLNMRLSTRIRPTLPEMRSYYQAHREDFHRDAKVTWREIFVKGKSAESRQKAESILERLRRGEEFAELARTASDGPTAAKGGQWETGLHASAAPAVNSALESLGLKQNSAILEGPKGYHIVRIDTRQEDGPAPFSVVQDKVHGLLFNQNFQREAEAYVSKLRSQSLITYWINGNAPAPANGERLPSPSDPQAIRTGATEAKKP